MIPALCQLIFHERAKPQTGFLSLPRLAALDHLRSINAVLRQEGFQSDILFAKTLGEHRLGAKRKAKLRDGRLFTLSIKEWLKTF